MINPTEMVKHMSNAGKSVSNSIFVPSQFTRKPTLPMLPNMKRRKTQHLQTVPNGKGYNQKPTHVELTRSTSSLIEWSNSLQKDNITQSSGPSKSKRAKSCHFVCPQMKLPRSKTTEKLRKGLNKSTYMKTGVKVTAPLKTLHTHTPDTQADSHKMLICKCKVTTSGVPSSLHKAPDMSHVCKPTRTTFKVKMSPKLKQSHKGVKPPVIKPIRFGTTHTDTGDHDDVKLVTSFNLDLDSDLEHLIKAWVNGDKPKVHKKKRHLELDEISKSLDKVLNPMPQQQHNDLTTQWLDAVKLVHEASKILTSKQNTCIITEHKVVRACVAVSILIQLID